MSFDCKILSVTILLLLFGACSPGPEMTESPIHTATSPAPTSAPTPEIRPELSATASEPAGPLGDVTLGEELFLANCAPCHGPDAKGADYAPSLIHPIVAAKDDAELKRTILDGRNTMPAWRGQLSREEISDILAFLRSQQP